MSLILRCVMFTSLLLLKSGWAKAEQAFMAPMARQSLLLDIVKMPAAYLAVGERGHILRSVDAEQWQQVAVPSLATLTAVTFYGKQVWTVGHDASILYSADEGLHWQEQYTEAGLEKPLLDVMFFNEKHGIAVGAYGLFMRTLDGGLNWTKELHQELLNPDDVAYLEELKQEDQSFYQQELQSILPHLNSLSEYNGTLYLAGEAGLVAQSDDFGQSWQRFEVDYSGSFFDVRRSLSGRLFVVGLRGNIFEYNHEQDQWLALNSGTTFTLNSIVPVNEHQTLVLGNNGAVVSIEAEQLHFSQEPDGKALINAVVAEQKLLAVSEAGLKILTGQGK